MSWLLLAALGCVPQTIDGDDDDDGDVFADSGAQDDDDDGIASLDPSVLPQGQDPCAEPRLVTIDRAIDGDTFYLVGTTDKVRAIGVDSSEIGYDGDPNECWAEEAKDYANDVLEGRKVWLTFDGECEDQYDRVLAYVHTGTGAEDFFQRALLVNGHAQTLTISPNDSYAQTLAGDEQAARDAGAGGWGSCGW